ncbi:MAG: VWA domain-containing protein [Isosphaeraceae bacterium]
MVVWRFLQEGPLSFAHPEQLWLLLILPILTVWAVRGRFLSRRAWSGLAQRGRAPRDGTLGLIACASSLIVAMAQPRWGHEQSPSLPPGHDVIIAIDVSRSMAVEDAVPNRLALAALAAESLVDALSADPANRVGLVAFAGRGVVRCPLTENLGAVLDALHRLRPGAVRPGGTDLGAALDAALQAMGAEEHAQGRAIVLFSDGEDHAARWSARLERLRQDDVAVHGVAIGDSDQGHPVPSGKNAPPLLYHGESVLSRRSDAALEQIARETGGVLIRLGLASIDLGSLYKTRIEPAARRRRETSGNKTRAERFPLCLLAALGLLLAGSCPLRRGWTWRWTSAWPWVLSRRAPKLGLGLIVVAGCAAITGAVGPGRRTGADLAAEAVARGQAAYYEGRLEEALSAFETAVSLVPRSAIPRYDAAAALFQLGRYEKAQERYLEAGQLADPPLRTKIDFVLGNTRLALGDITGAIAAYDQCLSSTARGTDIDSVRRDAAINRQFALEQSQSLTAPEGQSANDPSRSSQPDRKGARNRRAGGSGEESPDEQGENGPDAGGGGSGKGSEANPDQQRPPRNRRRVGGAGGARSSQSGPAGESPEDQLDAALERIHNAQNRRLPDDEPAASANDDRKDW